MADRRTLGQVLMDRNYLSRSDLRTVLKEAQKTGGQTGQVAVQLGLITEAQLLSAIGELFHLPIIDLEIERPDQRAVELVPQRLARAFDTLPFRYQNDGMTLVVSTLDKARWLLSDFNVFFPQIRKLKLALALPEQLAQARELAYSFDDDWYNRRELIDETNIMQFLPPAVRRTMWPRIFISYRRNDSEFQAHAIYKVLTERFGSEVFIDVDDIPAGVDFPTFLRDKVDHCDVVIALMGHHWMGTSAKAKSRLHESEDFVRIEIESSLKLGTPIVPVRLGDVPIPPQSELPESVRDLFNLHVIQLHARTFDRDVTRLVSEVEDTLSRTDIVKSAPDAIVDLDKYRIDESVREKIHSRFARRFNVIPLLQTKDFLFVASADPNDVAVVPALKRVTRSEVLLIRANADDIQNAIQRYYPEDDEE